MDSFDLRHWSGFQKAGGNLSSPAMIKQISLDSRNIDSDSLFIALKGARDDGHQFVSMAAKAGARYALVQEDWRPSNELTDLILLRVKDPLESFQDIASAYRQQQHAIVIGVTGSYGKTMLKDLLSTIVGHTKKVVTSPGSFNSQIGVPLSLLNIQKEDEVAIIEAGISHKNEMERLVRIISPNCAILTNVGNAHLSTLKDRETIAQEKMKLLSCLSTPQWVLLPQDPILKPYIPQHNEKYYYWNNESPSLPHAKLMKKDSGTTLPYHIKFPDGNDFSGKITSGFSYFLDLITIAIKAAWLLEIPSTVIASALEHYHPEPMRTEIWKSPLGATFINDTYCSDPQSVDLALRHFEQAPSYSKKVFVFGGMRPCKQKTAANYRRIGKTIARHQLDALMLYGNHDFSPVIEEINQASPKTEISLCQTYHEAVNQMKKKIHHDDVVVIKGPAKEPLEKVTEAFHESICNNQCLINLSAIRANLDTLRSKLEPATRVMVMVKALAYGTDDIRMAKFLASCKIDILGVSYVEEGVSLRRSGISQSIFVINAALYETAKVVNWDLEVGVSDHAMITALAKEAEVKKKVVHVHLHIDTGMSRFGCRPEEALSLAKAIVQSSYLKLEGVMTHFASADDPKQDPFTLSQVKLFEDTLQELNNHGISVPWQHASNSSAAIRFSLPQFNMVRIGLAIYGLYPSDEVKKTLELQLAIALTSRVVGINISKQGETISYGRTYTVSKPQQRIAVLPIGYFDGLHRNYSGRGEVIIRGERAPMVGKICMDYTMVDVTEIPDVQVGDSVLIFGIDEYGHYLSPEILAGKGDSIVYELITCLGPRIQRIFINE